MIVIYSQDKTYLHTDAASASADLIRVYGKKLGREAFDAINGAREGASYRKYGGPLVQVVSKEKAEEIFKRERDVGMIPD